LTNSLEVHLGLAGDAENKEGCYITDLKEHPRQPINATTIIDVPARIPFVVQQCIHNNLNCLKKNR
jgi:hypothetical protein